MTPMFLPFHNFYTWCGNFVVVVLHLNFSTDICVTVIALHPFHGSVETTGNIQSLSNYRQLNINIQSALAADWLCVNREELNHQPLVQVTFLLWSITSCSSLPWSHNLTFSPRLLLLVIMRQESYERDVQKQGVKKTKRRCGRKIRAVVSGGSFSWWQLKTKKVPLAKCYCDSSTSAAMIQSAKIKELYLCKKAKRIYSGQREVWDT